MSGLRGRLLWGFSLVAVPPLLILTGAALGLLRRSFEDAARERQVSGLRAVQDRIAEMRRRATAQLGAIATLELSGAPAEGPALRTLAASLAERRELAALEIVDAEGRVISSAHWEAGFGLPDRDAGFPGDSGFRIEKAESGYGAVERLALMPERRVSWRGRDVILRGGPFLDAEFLADVGRLMGGEVAFYDALRARWIAVPGSPLAPPTALPPPADRPSQPVDLAGAPYRWSAATVAPGLTVVVATPAAPLRVPTTRLVRVALLLAAAALAAALVAAWALSARLSRPIAELAGVVRHVAAGDLDRVVPVGGADETAELARAFNAMTRDLKASSERLVQSERVAAWREIAQRLAHELKKPLFPIQLSLETLLRSTERGPGGPLAELTRDSARTMLDEVRSLRAIVDEFSQFARMPRPRIAPTDVGQVAEQVLGLYRDRAAGVSIETSLPPELPRAAADADLLARAVGNLVANALEAMPEGGALRLRAFARDGRVGLTVADTGPGLGEEQRKRLFTPYYSTKRGGTGLGLAIVHGIVTDQGGTVEVDSEEGRGASFTILLPTTEAP